MGSRLIRLGVTAAVGALAAFSAVAPASAASADSAHSLKTRGGIHGAGSATPLVYGGGALETAPVVYIDYWGSQWATGFSSGGYTSGQAQTYTNDFFSSVGGSSWAKIMDQYNVSSPSGQLKGTWNDAVTLPRKITQSAIAAEALRLMAHFGGYNPNATYFVYTPSGHSMSGFRTSWCAWHSATSSGSNLVAYTYMPYQPDAGANCGMNFINANNSYGNGYFDGFSVVGGHEYAEAVTDPHPSSGWVDQAGSEIGDKCAWASKSTDITLGSHSYAVQPLFSNATLSCVTS